MATTFKVSQLIFSENSFLTHEESAFWSDKVYQLKDQWAPQGSNKLKPYYFTLGQPLYILKENLEFYKAEKERLNLVLKNNFEVLYDKVKLYFENLLGEPIQIDERLSLPGFHIYPYSMPDGGTIHFDRQHVYVLSLLQKEQWDLLNRLSFTICLDRPESGAGLNIWPESSFGSEAPVGKPEHKPYEIGHIYLLHTLLLHQIAPNAQMKAHEKRTTLQGHLLKNKKGHWVLYW